MRRHILLLALSIGTLLTFAPQQASAGEHTRAVIAGYPEAFMGYWREKARNQNAIVWGVIGVGIVGVLLVRSSGCRNHSY